MKTKYIITLLAVLPIVAGFTSCKSDEETTAKPAKEILRVLGGDIEIRANEENTIVNVSADCHWKVQDLENGDENGNNQFTSLTIQPREGEGDGTLIIGTDQNTTKANRIASFTLVSDGGLKQRVTITQTGSGDGMNLSRGEFTFEAAPTAAQPLTITSNTSWSIQIPDGVNWLHLDKTSGSGTDVVQLSADNAVSDATRSTTLVIRYGQETAEVTVNQEGMKDIYLYAPEQLSKTEAGGGSQVLRIESNAEWGVYIPSSVSWLHIEEIRDSTGGSHSAKGIGNGEIRIRCDQNTSTNDRLSAVVIIAGSRSPQQAIVLVEQSGAGQADTYSLTLSDLSSLYVGNTYAELRFSFVSSDDVVDYGVVYSTTDREPTRDNAEVVTVGRSGTHGNVLATANNLQPSTTYYVRGYVLGQRGTVYTPNMVTITTSSSQNRPGESDNPDPQLSR